MRPFPALQWNVSVLQPGQACCLFASPSAWGFRQHLASIQCLIEGMFSCLWKQLSLVTSKDYYLKQISFKTFGNREVVKDKVFYSQSAWDSVGFLVSQSLANIWAFQGLWAKHQKSTRCLPKMLITGRHVPDVIFFSKNLARIKPGFLFAILIT